MIPTPDSQVVNRLLSERITLTATGVQMETISILVHYWHDIRLYVRGKLFGSVWQASLQTVRRQSDGWHVEYQVR